MLILVLIAGFVGPLSWDVLLVMWVIVWLFDAADEAEVEVDTERTK